MDSDDFCLYRLFDEDYVDFISVYSKSYLRREEDPFRDSCLYDDLTDPSWIKNLCDLHRCATCLLTGHEMRRQRIYWEFTPCCELAMRGIGYDFPRHVLCHNCKRQYVTSKILEGRPFIQCPGTFECDRLLRDDEIKELVSEELFERYEQCQVSMKVDPLKKACPCCSKIYKAKNEDELKVSCPSCWLAWCFRCHSPWHDNMTCMKFQKGNRSLVIWAKNKKSKAGKCPKCNIYVENCDNYWACGPLFCMRCGILICTRCYKRAYYWDSLGNHYTWSCYRFLGCDVDFQRKSKLQIFGIRVAFHALLLLVSPVAVSHFITAGSVTVVGLIITSPFLIPYKIIQRHKAKRK